MKERPHMDQLRISMTMYELTSLLWHDADLGALSQNTENWEVVHVDLPEGLAEQVHITLHKKEET